MCNGEAGAYAEFVAEHPEYAFVGLNVADTPERARAFQREHGWTWPSIVDPDRELAKSLGAEYQPFVALIDGDGRLVATYAGGGDEAAWQALVERARD